MKRGGLIILSTCKLLYCLVKMAKPGIIIGILVGIFVAFGLLSSALSVVAALKLQNSGEAFAAVCCIGAAAVTIPFFILLCVTSPAAYISYNTTDRSCCTPTYYVSIAVAGSIAVSGAVTAGILQIFSVSNYEENRSDSELSSIGYAAAALSLITAAFGAVLNIVTITTYCKRQDEESYCSKEGVVGLILANILLTSCLVAAFLTFLSSIFLSSFLEDPEYSNTSTLTLFAAVFSGLAASFLILTASLSSLLCYVKKHEKKRALGAALLVWGLVFIGMLIGGALMMKAGEIFLSEDLNSDKLNRNSISKMAYLFGGLDFLTVIIALSYCCTGIYCCKKNDGTIM